MLKSEMWFWCYVTLYSILLIVCIYGSLSKFQLMLGEDNTQRFIAKTCRWVFRTLFLVILIFFALPLYLDIPYMLNKNYEEVEGKPTYVMESSSGSRQYVTINGVDLVFKKDKDFKEDCVYRCYYLPNSNYGIKYISLD